MSELGNAYLQGSGVKKTPDAALRYLRCAASLGDVGAQERESGRTSTGTRLCSYQNWAFCYRKAQVGSRKTCELVLHLDPVPVAD